MSTSADGSGYFLYHSIGMFPGKETLIAEGRVPESSGLELSPAKTLVFVDERRLAALVSARAMPVSLGVELLLARAVALVPFAEVQRRRLTYVPE